jgi:hypothetical protein
MIPSSTIDFDVIEARQKTKWSKCDTIGKSFVLTHLSRQIELDEPREVVPTSCPKNTLTKTPQRDGYLSLFSHFVLQSANAYCNSSTVSPQNRHSSASHWLPKLVQTF